MFLCSEKMLPGQQSADYMVGQVSGSLFQQNSAAPLSALFGRAAPPTALVFRPPPEVGASTMPSCRQKRDRVKVSCSSSQPVQVKAEVTTEKPAEVRGQPGCKRKKKQPVSRAEQRLEGRSDPPPVGPLSSETSSPSPSSRLQRAGAADR